MVLPEHSHLRWHLETYRFIPYIVHVHIYVVAILRMWWFIMNVTIYADLNEYL